MLTIDKEENILEINIETSNNYFSITGTIWEKSKPKTDKNIISCGCIHDNILEVRPNLKNLIELHLSSLDGIPMYAVENGYYFYQIINGTALHHKKEETDKVKYTKVLSDHLRISLNETNLLIIELDTTPVAKRKFVFSNFVSNQLDRWEKEAKEALLFIETI